MSKIWVPQQSNRRLLEERRQFAAELAQMMYVKGVMDEFNKELREIDPYLELVQAKEKVLAGNPLKPGYWHIVRHNPGAPPTVMTIEGENGEYIEPSAEIFRKLKEDNDMWNPATAHRRRKREAQLEEAKERRKVREREDRQQELSERWA